MKKNNLKVKCMDIRRKKIKVDYNKRKNQKN